MNKLADFWINQTLIEHETFESKLHVHHLHPIYI